MIWNRSCPPFFQESLPASLATMFSLPSHPHLVWRHVAVVLSDALSPALSLCPSWGAIKETACLGRHSLCLEELGPPLLQLHVSRLPPAPALSSLGGRKVQLQDVHGGLSRGHY